MLLIQQHLRDNVHTLESLYDKFGIHSKEKDGMVLFDYDQILSNKVKEHRVVKESRGLVLEKDTWNIIAKSFDRFFNYMETGDTDKFNWNNFSVFEKVDGSLIRVCVYKGEIQVFTRFSFADQQLTDLYKKTWSEEVLSCLTEQQISFIKQNPKYTYVFEFCSPYTQVVRFYSVSQLFMTAMFDNQTGEEISENNYVYKDAKVLFDWAKRYQSMNIDQINSHLDKCFDAKDTFEGFVVKDCNGIRLKIKSKWYLILHRLSNNGNIKNLKTLLPIILSGETSEIETYFPHLKEHIDILQIQIEEDLVELKNIYTKVVNIFDQKDFAITLQYANTPFSGIFFKLRKEFGRGFTFQQLEEEFMKSEELVLKVYKTRGMLE